MKFDGKYLKKLLWGGVDEKECRIVEDKIEDKSRWSINHSLIFEKDGKFYQTDCDKAVKFSREYLRELLCGNIDKNECRIIEDKKECRIVKNKIVNMFWWSINRRFVFEKDGILYQAGYSVGATEPRNESPFEYDGNEIDCQEVEPVETTIIEYKPVK